MNREGSVKNNILYALMPLISYIIGVVLIELLLTLLLYGFSFLALRSGSSLLFDIDVFLFENEELIIPGLAGLIKIPQFLKHYYYDDWSFRVNTASDKKRPEFNMEEAYLWKKDREGRQGRGILESFTSIKNPILIIALSLCACIFFNILVNYFINIMHLMQNGLWHIADVGGVGGPDSAFSLPGADTVYTDISLTVLIISSVFIAPVVEELVFRGIIYMRMRDNYGFLISAVVSALSFGLIHFNLIQGIFAFFMGLIFAYIYERSHKLCSVIIAHASVNVLNIFMMLPVFEGFYKRLGEDMFLSILLFTVFGILTLTLLFILKKKMKKTDYMLYTHLENES